MNLFWEAPKSLQMVAAAMKLRLLLLGRQAMNNLDSTLKSRDIYFASKGPSSPSFGFSSSHVWMWQSDYKENWELKNWCFCLFCFFFFLICSEFCHTLKWNVLEFTCLHHPDPPSHLPLHPLPPGPPRAPGPSACLIHPTWAGDLFHPW